MSKKIGLCFTGGGARGAYQIGAAEALSDLGILNCIQAFSGTSIGAANVAIIGSASVEKAKEIWFNIPHGALSKSDNFLNRLKTEKFKALDKGIYTMDTFNSIMNSNIDHDALSEKDIFVTVSESGDMSKGIFELFKSTYRHYIKKDSKVLYIPLRELSKIDSIEAVTASCSIPVVFPAVTNENKKYYDGGVFDNTPIQPLIDVGCEEIIVVAISAYKVPFLKTDKYPNVTIHEIKHKGSLGGVLDFSNKHSRKIYEYGYDDTIAYFKKNSEI